MKAKIDLEKFICSLMKRFYETHNIDPITTECWLDKVLKDQGLEYKNGEIVEILQESEDEKIRKAIIDYLTMMWGNSQDDVCGVHVEDAIEWLEKQGQKPTLRERYESIAQSEWFKRTHEGMSCGMITPEESLGISSEKYNEIVNECIFGDDKKPKWTKEDDERQISITEYLNELYDDNRFSLDELTDLETWLNSLKQRMEE